MKNLIISPHIDDEVLGCYSALNQDTFVYYMGVEDRSYVSAKERIEEVSKAASLKQFKWEVSENEVNRYQCCDLIGIIENKINEFKPECVFIPHYSYNQDHRAVYDAAMVALRHHDINWFVSRVLIYEQPHTILWPYKEFIPNYFVEIDISDKINTYNLYKTQVREHRSAEMIQIMASLRGKQSNLKFAEAFQCIRYIVRNDNVLIKDIH